MFQTNGIQQINQCRQVAQQLIQQTQQANGMYKQMLQREQQNATTLEQMAQRERQAVQMIEQSLHGHEMAIQRCQEVINLCNQMEQQLSHQFVPQGMQQQFNHGQMNQRITQH